jgi:hypothetical protein
MAYKAIKNKSTVPHSLTETSSRHQAQKGYLWRRRRQDACCAATFIFEDGWAETTDKVIATLKRRRAVSKSSFLKEWSTHLYYRSYATGIIIIWLLFHYFSTKVKWIRLAPVQVLKYQRNLESMEAKNHNAI